MLTCYIETVGLRVSLFTVIHNSVMRRPTWAYTMTEERGEHLHMVTSYCVYLCAIVYRLTDGRIVFIRNFVAAS